MKKAFFGLVLAFWTIEKAATQVAIGPILNFAATPFKGYGPERTYFESTVSSGAVVCFSAKRHRFLTGFQASLGYADVGHLFQWPSQHNPAMPGTFDPNAPPDRIIDQQIGLFLPLEWRVVLREKSPIRPFFALGGAVGVEKWRRGAGTFSAQKFEKTSIAKAGFGLETDWRGDRFFLLLTAKKGFKKRSTVTSKRDWDTEFSPSLEAGWLFNLKHSKN